MIVVHVAYMGAARSFSETAPKNDRQGIIASARARPRRMVTPASFSDAVTSFVQTRYFPNPCCRSSSERVSHHHGIRADASRGSLRAALGLRRVQCGARFGREILVGRRKLRLGFPCCRLELLRRRLGCCGRREGGSTARRRGRGQRRQVRCGRERCGAAGNQRTFNLRARMSWRLQGLQSRYCALLWCEQSDAECGCGLGLRQPLYLQCGVLGRSVWRRSASQLCLVRSGRSLRPRLQERKQILCLPRRHDLSRAAKVAHRLLSLAMSAAR